MTNKGAPWDISHAELIFFLGRAKIAGVQPDDAHAT